MLPPSSSPRSNILVTSVILLIGSGGSTWTFPRPALLTSFALGHNRYPSPSPSDAFRGHAAARIASQYVNALPGHRKTAGTTAPMATGIVPASGGHGGNGDTHQIALGRCIEPPSNPAHPCSPSHPLADFNHLIMKTDRNTRRKPFSTLIKRLAAFKSSSHHRHNHVNGNQRSNDAVTNGNNASSASASNGNQVAFSDPPHSIAASGSHTRAASMAGSSHAQTYTSSTVHSSPSQSVQSLATLTTVQSTAPPSTYLANGMSSTYNPHLSSHNPNAPPQHFTHQFTISPSPAGLSHTPSNSQGIPTTLPHPTTYQMMTQGNMLSDDASILTLASSSRKRERRRSLDTDASIRALPPSSLWGGSKESLPLSVLSGGDRATMGDRASLFAERHKDRDSVVLGATSSPLVTPSHPTFFGGSTSGGERADDDDANTDGRSIAKYSTKRGSTGTSLLSIPLQGPDTEPDTVK
ncbi:hypothetical protein Dda_2310 [Drechslerella dactyloides]|uniref:Uncharacterized protein n=1 Tax=Drechslerella dactyloides TaxID=74499 RepID=A0AAD6NMW7_DREDA|nr:hypothetical protein Dda_2310 [Drechslerella dactyloides]